MKVLVACEYSGRVRDAFRALGHDATSCDLLPTDVPGPHYEGDVRDILHDGWDLMVAHPECTYFAGSGSKHLYMLDRKGHTLWVDGERIPNLDRLRRRAASLEFVLELAGAPIERIAIENPVGTLSSLWRKPDQYIQPWQFGHGETKKTGLWLKNLPPLVPTNIVEGREQRIWKLGPSPDRWKIRSETFHGIAEAMAAQWGDVS